MEPMIVIKEQVIENADREIRSIKVSNLDYRCQCIGDAIPCGNAYIEFILQRVYDVAFAAGVQSVEMPPIYNVDTSLLKRELKDGIYVDSIGSIEVKPL